MHDERPPSDPDPGSSPDRGDLPDRGDEPGDLAAFSAISDALADAVDAALASWVVRMVEERLLAWQAGTPVAADVLARAAEMGEEARTVIGGQLRDLLALDLDDQPTNPLTIVRRAVRYPTRLLTETGVPPVVRDEFDESAFPDDPYALSPTRFADLDESVHEPGLMWGAAKAHLHLARRRRAGMRSDR